MVDRGSKVAGLEKVDRVEVGHVDAPRVGLGTLRPVLLDVHAEEAHVHPVLLLEGKHGAGPVRKVVQHLSSVNVPGEKDGKIIFAVVWMGKMRLAVYQQVKGACISCYS